MIDLQILKFNLITLLKVFTLILSAFKFVPLQKFWM